MVMWGWSVLLECLVRKCVVLEMGRPKGAPYVASGIDTAPHGIHDIHLLFWVEFSYRRRSLEHPMLQADRYGTPNGIHDVHLLFPKFCIGGGREHPMLQADRYDT
jgi:hypothetical protein